MDEAEYWCKWGFMEVVKDTFDWISSVVCIFMRSNAFKQPENTASYLPTDLMFDHYKT